MGGLFLDNLHTPTHFTNTCDTLLDLFFVNVPSKILFYDPVSVPVFSKHDLIFLTYDLTMAYNSDTFEFRDYTNINCTELYNKCDWTSIYMFPNIEHQLNIFNSNIEYLYNNCVLIRKKTIHPKRNPWLTHNIKTNIAIRDASYNKWKRYKTAFLERNTLGRVIMFGRSSDLQSVIFMGPSLEIYPLKNHNVNLIILELEKASSWPNT